ncbi:MAG TPA: hypothetical protein VGR61_04055, partial [Candidatus Dormibacteraeota bacterium]|nr:hypothetical protein [Candidatus Dormibacteraeota bacterium]
MADQEATDILFVMHARVRDDDPVVGETRRVAEANGWRVRVFRRHGPEDRPGRFDGGWELGSENVEGVALVVT